METEFWKDIEWYEGLYQISNLGNIKALAKKVFNKHNNKISLYKEKILTPTPTWRDLNYSKIILYKNLKTKRFSIHRLVAQAFLWLDINNKKILVLHKLEKLDEKWLLYNWVDNLFLWDYNINWLDCVKKWRHKRWWHDSGNRPDFSKIKRWNNWRFIKR